MLTLSGVSAACTLAIEHGNVTSYGGNIAVVGWFEVAGCVLGCLILGVLAAVRKDIATHQKWMTRYYGAMWGSFLVFRLIFLFAGPVFRSVGGVLTPLAIWVSAPLGILIAEWVRLRNWAPPAGEEKSRAD